METTKTILEDGRIEASIVVSAAEVTSAYDQVPDGEAAAVLGLLAKRFLDEADPIPVTTPLIAAPETPVAGRECRFTVTYLPARKYTLGAFPELVVNVPLIEVDDAMVEEQVARIVKSDPLFKGKVPKETVEQDSVVEMYIKATHEGKIFGGLTGQREYTMGSGFMPTGFEMALMGKKAGDIASYVIDVQRSPADKDDTIPVQLEISVKRVSASDPSQIDNEWVRNNFDAFQTVAEFKAFLRSEMEAYVDTETHQIILDQAVRELSGCLNEETPDAYIQALYEDSRRAIISQIEAEGSSLSDYLRSQRISPEDFEMDLLFDARQRHRHDAVLDAVADHYAIQATAQDEQDYLEEMVRTGVADDTEGFRDSLYTTTLRSSVRKFVAARLITEKAKVLYT